MSDGMFCDSVGFTFHFHLRNNNNNNKMQNVEMKMFGKGAL